MQAVFIVRTGVNVGAQITVASTPLPAFRHPVFTIGIDERCHLVISDLQAAPVHATVYEDDEAGYIIQRYKESYTLTVDGEHVHSAPLYDGCVIRVGKTVLTFVSKEKRKAKSKTSDAPAPAYYSAPASITPAVSTLQVKPFKKPARQFEGLSLLIFLGIFALIGIVGTAAMKRSASQRESQPYESNTGYTNRNPYVFNSQPTPRSRTGGKRLVKTSGQMTLLLFHSHC